tara:strand:- start:1249 stop:1497 length:249 start_codon:yes stop_codon:yes gene_type:complete
MPLAWTSWTDDFVTALATQGLSVGDVFSLRSVYELEDVLKRIRPNNTKIRAKIRQQLQVLKHHNVVEFVNNNGVYRLIKSLD